MTLTGWPAVIAAAPSKIPLFGRVYRHAGSILTRTARVAGLPARAVWSRPGRHHIEVKGVNQVGSEGLARRVEQSLEKLPGVAWARVNAPSGRVVVAVCPPEPRLDDVIAAVAAAERARPVEPDPEVAEPQPPEEGPRTPRALSTMAADALGLGLAAATRILPFTPVPGEIAGLANVVDLHPRLHALLGKALHGQQRADSALPLVEALAQGLTGRWAGIVVDGAKRVWQWSEARAQLATWESFEEQLTGTPERAAAGPVPDERPRAKPDGPVQRYSARVLNAAGLAAGAALPVAGFKRAAALGLAALPKAAVTGLEAYGAHLGRVLARRGVLAMDRGVLRELDRIDTLILDEAVLQSDRATLTDLVPLPGAETGEVATRAFTLFDPDEPTAVRHADGWSLGPLDRLALPGLGDSEPARRLGEEGGLVLGLAADNRPQAVIKVESEPVPGLESVVAAARQSGVRLIVAGEHGRRPDFADDLMPGNHQLAASVRTLQADGATVMLISANQHALARSDCGVGISHPDRPPPWGAHLVIGPELNEAALVVAAIGTARTVAGHGIALSGASSSLGALLAFTSPRWRLPGRALVPVNAAAGLAFADGAWRARQLHRQPAPPPAAAAPWHLMPAEIVLARLSSGPEGLASEEVQRRSSGEDPGKDAGAGLAHAFAEELANPLTPVLAAGAGLSGAVGSPIDAGLVGGVVALSALIGAVQKVRTERSLAALLSRSAVSARVRRDGSDQVISADDLVPGDIIIVEPNDVIPADCRILEAAGLEADESSLTGESLPVVKSSAPVVAAAVADRTSMLYEGTTVAAGNGRAVVVATGADTEVGRGIAMARQTSPTTGVEARLARLTRVTVPVAAGAAATVVGAGMVRGIPLTQTVASAANLAVASVPEGLPFLVNAAQLAAARRLAEHGALVRNPRTIEALGRVDVLCFDKTGTLTEGRLKLAGVGDGSRYARLDGLNEPLRDILAAALRATPPADEPEQLARQTDRAVLAGASAAGVNADTGAPGWARVSELPFEPSRGYHATVGRHGAEVLLSVKGAPETVLPRCRRHRTPQGEQDLDQQGRDDLRHRLEQHAAAGHRILALAERQIPDHARLPDGEEPVTDADVDELTFVGFLAIADVVRDSAAPAVRRIRDAGVQVIMITGDHPATAEAIASTINPDDGGQRVVTGAELDRLDDDALAELLGRTDVVARCTPTQKVRIIQILRGRGRTVAMTGDGANDAPAIRLADVGIALGERGTPAARAAADLVVTDDHLETIIAALIEGRAMWSSVRHALSVLIGGNIGEIAFSVLSAAATGRSALNGRQILLVNLLTDLAPAMTMAVRPPRPEETDDLLGEGPDVSLGSALTRETTVRATTTTLGASAAWTLARVTGRRRRAGTVALAALVGTQLGQTALAGGATRGTVAASIASAAVLGAIIQTPGLSHFFGCTPLGPVGWGIATSSAVGATVSSLATKHLPRPEPHR
ncbi:MAG TPA: HAD-IC family P-type ATPase [Micromonospora sp.]|nr:HAD-IC family P-type ATPase [Micromonospora sp.]